MSLASPRLLAVVAAGLAVTLQFGGCFAAPSGDVLFSCDPENAPQCPSGYTCEPDACCHREGSDVQASFGSCRTSVNTSAAPVDDSQTASSSAGGPTGSTTASATTAGSATASTTTANTTEGTGLTSDSGTSSAGRAAAPAHRAVRPQMSGASVGPQSTPWLRRGGPCCRAAP